MAGKKCNGCEDANCANHIRPSEQTIPYVVFESLKARHELKDKRAGAVIIALISLLVLNNLGWMLLEVFKLI